MEEDLRMIMNHFGIENQLEKLREEAKEYLESDYDISEIADIYVVVKQLYNASPEIQEIVRQKIQRTLSRMETGYYEKKE